MDLQARKYQIIEELMSIQNADKLASIEAILHINHDEIDLTLQEAMTSRVKLAEENIKTGRVYSYDEAKTRLSNKLKNR